MYYVEIKMVESMFILMKVFFWNLVCWFCGDFYESCYMLWIFSKVGLGKDLCVKVYKICGIKILEDDMRLKVLCRSCVLFVNKME